MSPLERSPWALATMSLTVGLLAASLVLPWFSFHHSTGSRTPPGTSDGEPEVTRRDLYYAPFHVAGDASDAQREEGRVAVTWLGGLLVVAAFFGFVNLTVESLGGSREGTRTLQLWLTAIGFLVVLAALAFAWIAFPALLAGEGVTGVFTTRNDQATFIRSTLSWGWPVAALALIPNAAAFALKYAGGAFTLGFLEQYRSEPR